MIAPLYVYRGAGTKMSLIDSNAGNSKMPVNIDLETYVPRINVVMPAAQKDDDGFPLWAIILLVALPTLGLAVMVYMRRDTIFGRSRLRGYTQSSLL